MLLVYPPHVLHELGEFWVVLDELRTPRLGQGSIRPSAVVLDGPPMWQIDFGALHSTTRTIIIAVFRVVLLLACYANSSRSTSDYACLGRPQSIRGGIASATSSRTSRRSSSKKTEHYTTPSDCR